ncbi:MAG: hypothetical protein IJV59_07595 [Eubacterium sp.]|nr:hypothetical protein [Eubacterium sp.]
MLSKRFRVSAKNRLGYDEAVYVAMPSAETINITIGQGTEQIDIYISSKDFLSALYELKNGKPFTGRHAMKTPEETR